MKKRSYREVITRLFIAEVIQIGKSAFSDNKGQLPLALTIQRKALNGNCTQWASLQDAERSHIVMRVGLLRIGNARNDSLVKVVITILK